MKVVFVHRQGPGQFLHLAPHLAAAGWRVTLLCETADARMPGVEVVRYRAEPAMPASGPIARYLAGHEHHVRIGMSVAEALDVMCRREGAPRVVVGHIGWGGLLFAKDVLPDTPMIGYCEYFYRAEGGDVGFDPDETVSLDDRQRTRLRNTGQLVTLEAIEAGLSPTQWQRSRYPGWARRRIALCHEGVEVDRCRPDPRARLALPDGRTVAAGDPVVTYVARDLEPYRGFPQFMRAARKVAERVPDAVFVVAGGDGVSYGRRSEDGRPWREVMMRETGLDPRRIIFLGRVDHPTLIRLFQVSRAHVYLTYPFVLSWSVLEAMACGCLVVGSATPPVEEVVSDGVNGLLADFWDIDALAARVTEALAEPRRHDALRAAARRTIQQHYALPACLERQTAIVNYVVGATRPAARAAAATR